MDGNHSHHGFPKLDLVEPELVVENRNNDIYVADVLRKKWLLLTPEEWVRQHALNWLLTQTRFPRQLLSIERQVVGRQRADILGYNRSGNPLLLVECKAPEIPVSEMTVQQALVYNQNLKAPFVWLTNGLNHVVLKKTANQMEFKKLNALPIFEEMAQT